MARAKHYLKAKPKKTVERKASRTNAGRFFIAYFYAHRNTKQWIKLFFTLPPATSGKQP